MRMGEVTLLAFKWLVFISSFCHIYTDVIPDSSRSEENMYYQMEVGDDKQTDSHHESIIGTEKCHNNLKYISHPLMDESASTVGLHHNLSIKMHRSPDLELVSEAFYGIRHGSGNNHVVEEYIGKWNLSTNLETIGSLRVLKTKTDIQCSLENIWIEQKQPAASYMLNLSQNHKLQTFYLNHNFTSDVYKVRSILHLKEEVDDTRLLEITIHGHSPEYTEYDFELIQNVEFQDGGGRESCMLNSNFYDVQVTGDWKLPQYYRKHFKFLSNQDSWSSFDIVINFDTNSPNFVLIRFEISGSHMIILSVSDGTFHIRSELEDNQTSEKILQGTWKTNEEQTKISFTLSDDMKEFLLNFNSVFINLVGQLRALITKDSNAYRLLFSILKLDWQTLNDLEHVFKCLWKQQVLRLFIYDNFLELLHWLRYIEYSQRLEEIIYRNPMALLDITLNIAKRYGFVRIDGSQVEIVF